MYESCSTSTIMLITLFAVLVLGVLWSRRKMYIISWQLPGPIALPLIGNAHYLLGLRSTEDMFKRFYSFLTNYGTPVRIWMGPRLIIGLSNPEDLEVIYNNPLCFEKDLTVLKGMRASLGDGLITAPVSIWKPHRKLISPAFSPKILNSFVGTFVENANILADRINIHVGQGAFDIFPYVFQTTVHFICETSMDLHSNILNELLDTLTEYLDETMAICFQRMAKPWLYPDFLFNLSSLGRNFNRNMKFLNQMCNKVIQRKREELKEKKIKTESAVTEEEEDILTVKRKNFMDLLIEMNYNGRGFTDKELRDQVKTFISGGSDTTAIEISFACMLLGAHPDCQEKAYAEIKDIFGDSDRDITESDLSQMKYIERVLKETLRLFPPLPLLVRYLHEDVKFATMVVPAGTTILFTNFSTHRDPKIWPNPLKFDPDRFLPEEVAKRHPYSYVPFGGGPRNCIGLRYAMMSMKILLCTLLRKYTFKSDINIEKVRITVEIIMKAIDGHPVEIELRKK